MTKVASKPCGGGGGAAGSCGAAAPAFRHADFAGLWVSAGSERDGHVAGSRRCHFPVAGTLWIEQRERGESFEVLSYELAGDALELARRPGSRAPVAAWLEAGFLILRDAEDYETWFARAPRLL